MLIDLIERGMCRLGLHWFEPVPGINALECIRPHCDAVRPLR